jgi:prolyl-tRNA synthetase
VPYRITVGKKLVQGKVEVVNRRTRETVEVAVQDAPGHVKAGLAGA